MKLQVQVMRRVTLASHNVSDHAIPTLLVVLRTMNSGSTKPLPGASQNSPNPYDTELWQCKKSIVAKGYLAFILERGKCAGSMHMPLRCVAWLNWSRA
jgi:hypothetical protein